MNKKAAAYIARYGVDFAINGRIERMLPLNRLQGFFDLIQPGDVPPDKLQRLYEAQATGVAQIRKELRKAGWIEPAEAENTEVE